MVLLTVLSGQTAGAEKAARRFPFTLGRGQTDGLILPDPGVWERHAEISLNQGSFVIRRRAGAILSVNGERVENGPLRNGDLLELGAARVRFWLGPAPKRGLRWREAFVWFLIAAVLAGQMVLIYSLL